MEIHPRIRFDLANKCGKCSEKDEVEHEIVTEFDDRCLEEVPHSSLQSRETRHCDGQIACESRRNILSGRLQSHRAKTNLLESMSGKIDICYRGPAKTNEK